MKLVRQQMLWGINDSKKNLILANRMGLAAREMQITRLQYLIACTHSGQLPYNKANSGSEKALELQRSKITYTAVSLHHSYSSCQTVCRQLMLILEDLGTCQLFLAQPQEGHLLQDLSKPNSAPQNLQELFFHLLW